MALLDAHQHCWQLQRPECRWPNSDLPPLYRDFTPEELQAEARPLGVEGSILVQSQPDDRDTDYLLELAEQNDFIRGVVGWADLKADNASERITRLARNPKLRGLRPMLQDMPEDDWIADPLLAPAVGAMIEAGLVLDALVYSRHLPHLNEFARRYPGLSIVVDHAAKPPIAEGAGRVWQAEMARLASNANIYCKLSGLLTEASPGQGTAELQPWVDELLELFGAERLLWGSDWPVINLVADYRHWLDMSGQLLSSLSQRQRQRIFADTARAVYRL